MATRNKVTLFEEADDLKGRNLEVKNIPVDDVLDFEEMGSSLHVGGVCLPSSGTKVS